MNQISLAPIFQINIFKYSITNWEEKKPKLLSLLDFSDDGVLQSGDTVHTDFYTEKGNPSYFEDWIDILKDDFNDIFNQGDILVPPPMGYDSEERKHLLCTPKESPWQLWSQSYDNGHYHGAHNHGVGNLSCCLYLEFDPNYHLGAKFYSPYVDPWTGFYSDATPQVEEGDILMFPSMLLHEAPNNQSEVRRTIMAFNIPLK